MGWPLGLVGEVGADVVFAVQLRDTEGGAVEARVDEEEGDVDDAEAVEDPVAEHEDVDAPLVAPTVSHLPDEGHEVSSVVALLLHRNNNNYK